MKIDARAPIASPPPAELEACQPVVHTTGHEASFDPQTTPISACPPAPAPTQGDKRTHLGLTSLALTTQQLTAEATRASPAEVLASATHAIGRVRAHFRPQSAEQKMCDVLAGWLSQAEHESPAQSAVSLVGEQFPNLQSPAHGAFKGIAGVIDGAIQGRLAAHPSEVAKVAFGFVPVVGTLLDVEDLYRALSNLQAHKDGAGVDVAIAGVAFIPGLDCLKTGKTVAGRQALRAAAEEMPHVSVEGLAVLARKIGPEAAAAGERQLRTFNVARTELMARIERSLDGVSQNLRGLLEKAHASLAKHAQPNDIVGAMRDVAGVPVAKAAGGVFDHKREVQNTLNSVKKAVDAVGPRPFLESALHDCRKLLAEILEKT